MNDPDAARDAYEIDGYGAPSHVRARHRTVWDEEREARRMTLDEPVYDVWRDLDDSGVPELVQRPAAELTAAEVAALPDEKQADVLRRLGAELEMGSRGWELVSAS